MKNRIVRRASETITFSLPKELVRDMEAFLSRQGAEYANRSHFLKRIITDKLKEPPKTNAELFQPAGFAE